MLVAAALCPHPPLLIPEAMGASGADPGPGDAWLTELRAACVAAVTGLAAARPDLITVVGGGDRSAEYDPAAAGSLRSFGIPFSTGQGEPVLPLSLTVGSWLARRVLANGATGRCQLRLQAVQATARPAECLRLGAALARRRARVAMLVMGDGSARRVLHLHGVPDPQAESYDAGVAAALEAADADRLAGLDPRLDGELMVAGRAAWQVLAGAAAGARLRGRLLFAAAPLDVGYLVASWHADGD